MLHHGTEFNVVRGYVMGWVVPSWVWWVLLAWNVLVFLIYGIDKRRAIKGKYRISERTLLLLAMVFGGLGAVFGVFLLRHKITRPKFIYPVPVLLMIQVMMVVILLSA